MTLQRVQMLLEPQQHSKLVKLAKLKGKSVAEVTRLAIDKGLEQMEVSEQQVRMLNMLEEARLLRESMPLYKVDLIADLEQMRQERDNDQPSGD
ncbi:MAG: hypothetical protein MUC85_04425 [Anaerolineales bacterium]|nr:hypothetical protein [Anaerolineales bacterium]